jgi:hypothetical protein
MLHSVVVAATYVREHKTGNRLWNEDSKWIYKLLPFAGRALAFERELRGRGKAEG